MKYVTLTLKVDKELKTFPSKTSLIEDNIQILAQNANTNKKVHSC